MTRGGWQGNRTMDERAALIGIDWGTSSFRAYRIGRAGILERRSRDAGILRVEGGDFAGTLSRAIGDWLAAEPQLPVVAAGMVGSRQGWREVPYVPCPAGLPELATGLLVVDAGGGRMVHLVPGLVRPGAANDFPDVMRGEETQILGDLAAGRSGADLCYVLPGTHSKWAWCQGGRITRFATYMTGEVYDVLVRHSILGRLMSEGSSDPAAFDRGLTRARASAAAAPGRLLHDLFSARTLGLMAELEPTAIGSYLSGLLIGAELISAAAASGVREVVILGSSALSPLYARALKRAGLGVTIGDPDAAAHGLHAVAAEAGLIAEHIDA